MRISTAGLSPAAHGTLRALQSLREVHFVDEDVARELVARGYAALIKGRLRITGLGKRASLYSDTPRVR
jgi:hypothetical protein